MESLQWTGSEIIEWRKSALSSCFSLAQASLSHKAISLLDKLAEVKRRIDSASSQCCPWRTCLRGSDMRQVVRGRLNILSLNLSIQVNQAVYRSWNWLACLQFALGTDNHVSSTLLASRPPPVQKSNKSRENHVTSSCCEVLYHRDTISRVIRLCGFFIS